MGSANANSTWQTSNGNVVGNTVQFDWRGGTATYVLNVADGSTISVTVDNTIANTIGYGAPTPDEWRVSINGETFQGNTVGIITVSAVASGQVVVSVYGKDIGFWGGWYGPIFYAPVVTSPVIVQDTVTSIVETQTPAVSETVTVPSISDSRTSTNSEPSTSVLPNPDTLTPVLDTSDSSVVALVPSSETQTVISAPVETQTSTSESSTQTIPSETSTLPIETPLPTPPPVVEPQPVPSVVVSPSPEPSPQPLPVEPTPLPDPVVESEVVEILNGLDEVAPLEEPPLEEQPVVEEQPPVEESSELPVEEETNETPVEEPEILEQPELTPEPLPQPVVVPEPVIQPDVAYTPPSNDGQTVTLDNGVVITEEEAAAIVLLSNPAELISELFSDPGAVFSALGSVGADMSPEVREKSEKVVLASVIAGNIATQAAATAGAVAAYRRKP